MPTTTHACQTQATPASDADAPRIACDAMCGGLARWLRAIGVDAWYVTGVTDDELVHLAIRERRIVVSSDGPLFRRRVLARGELRGVRIPVGLRLLDQVRFVVRELGLAVGFPRCTLCNGELAAVRRDEVGDVVPARSLIWAREFFRCERCGHVYWEGTHWRRIGVVRSELATIAADATPRHEPPHHEPRP